MTWKLETGPDGLPEWRGEDAVVNPFWRTKNEQRAWVGLGLLVGVLIFLGVMLNLALAAIEGTARGNIEDIGLLAFLIFGCWAFYKIAKRTDLLKLPPPTPQFYQRQWKLSASASELTFEAGEFSPALQEDHVSPRRWSVPLDLVARVESTLTREWQPGRHYIPSPMGEGFQAVPPVEYQTFLFLGDGSRRVITTRNADREGAATLAHSVRSWLDTRRAAPIPAPIAAAPAPRPSIEGEGFNL